MEMIDINSIGFLLGYDSVGMAKCRGFEKIGICLVCHNGDHNDTICLKEVKCRNSSHD